MNRYTIPLQIDTTKNVPYYKTDIVTPIPSEDIPYYYVTQEGDRLDTISSLFYDTPNNWWILAKANNLANGTIAIPAGTQLFIPNL
jgi:LysM domain